ncbi:Hypothetical predicted protein, partial [Pelobates cultripes]
YAKENPPIWFINQATGIAESERQLSRTYERTQNASVGDQAEAVFERKVNIASDVP